MKLIFITQNVDDGDAVLGFLPGWLRELSARVDRIIVITFQAGALPAMPPNVEIRSLGRERGARGIRLLMNYRRELRRALREGGDTLLAHMVPKYAVLARWLGVPKSIPMYLWYTHAGINRWLRICEPMVNKIFTASEESLRLPTSKKVVTRHGIDINYLAPAAGEVPAPGKLTTVGRLTPSKDAETLIRGCAALRARGENVQLDVIGGSMAGGDDAYAGRMRTLCKELNCEDSVQFAGFVPYKEIAPVYRSAWIFVNASRTGSVDKAVLEAMACGSLVLTSNESFVHILPPEHRFRERDTDDFVKKASSLLRLDDGARAAAGASLRAIVERDHAVAPLMARLVAEMQESAEVHIKHG
ncbi:MAG: glycosyltransferase family 4 protein [Planctomycetes bacterium]|nr:glycosyltransferase family 4 protein [Planctomycetota bacterium]